MVKDFLHLSMDFIKENWLDISLAGLGILFIISYIIVNNIKIEPPQHLRKGRTIVLETLQNKSATSKMEEKNDAIQMLKKGFCEYNKQSHTLEKNCNKLSKKSCNAVSCCVYAHNNKTKLSKCVAGTGNNGPTYKGDNKGNYYDYDYWYYLGKKYPEK